LVWSECSAPDDKATYELAYDARSIEEIHIFDFDSRGGSEVFLHRPQGGGIRGLTGKHIIQSNQYKEELLIRHTGRSDHGSGGSGPKWHAPALIYFVEIGMFDTSSRRPLL